jgi:hypothetical protein
MRTRIFALTALAALFLNVVGFAAADTRRAKAKQRQASRLISLLPASDGVAVFDAKRFLDDALPKVLSANQPMLSEIMSKISEVENRTGIDLRKFDQVAVGIAFKQVSATETDFEPLLVAGGDIKASALVAVAKMASSGKYREEKIGERKVYIFTPKDVVQNPPIRPPNAKITAAMDMALKAISNEVAVTAIDKNTLAMGSLARVRETLEGTTHAGSDLTSLLSVKETAVMSFAVKPPGGMSKVVPLEMDEMGKNIDTIQYLSGSLDVAVTGTSLQMMARTKMADQAVALKEMLDGLQVVGGAIFGNSKRLDQKVYGRMIKNAKFEARGTDVTLDLLVPQADIDILVAGIK